MLRTYALATVTYGTTPASFMAIQCLVILEEEVRQKNPKLSEIILRYFYMDDLMTGCDSEDECIQLHKDINKVLSQQNYHSENGVPIYLQLSLI